MSESEQAPEGAVEDGAVAVAESAETETVHHEAPDDDVVALEEEVAAEAIPVPMVAPARQAKILLCERGHRTVAVWSAPTTCHARPTRSGAECGRQLYPIGELPEQVQKALNPLKASKKASKG